MHKTTIKTTTTTHYTLNKLSNVTKATVKGSSDSDMLSLEEMSQYRVAYPRLSLVCTRIVYLMLLVCVSVTHVSW